MYSLYDRWASSYMQSFRNYEDKSNLKSDYREWAIEWIDNFSEDDSTDRIIRNTFLEVKEHDQPIELGE